MDWKRVVNNFKSKRRHIPEEKDWADAYHDKSIDSQFAIRDAYRNKLERYLTWMDPKSLGAMSREIDDATLRIMKKSFYIIILVSIISWLFGYQSCRSNAVDFIEPSIICNDSTTEECIERTWRIQKYMEKYLALF
ncbi:hypothetical protein K9F62_03525 [Desulfovibrio sp. JY]|nr:hypothetical protein K9F62_03525 [Desulfovibrio sp. JY]